MAIAFVAALGQVQGGGASTQSLTSLSITGTDIVILAAIRTETTSKTVSSLNWDDGSGGSAQSFAQIGGYQNAEAGNHRVSLWYLAGASTTNSRIIATISANDVMYLAATYYTGVKQSAIFTAAAEGSGTGTSQLATSDADGSWHVGVGISANGGFNLASGGLMRQTLNSGGTAGNLLDSNATVANTATNTFTWDTTGTPFAWVTAMMRPPGGGGGGATASPTAGLLNLMGVGS